MDPTAGPLAAFAASLRELRGQAGNPTYADLARRTGVSASALSEAARGQKLPTWPIVEAYVRGCGADPDDWKHRWAAVNGVDVPATPAADPGPQNEDAVLPAVTLASRWLPLGLAVILLVLAATAAVMLGHRSRPTPVAAAPRLSARPSSEGGGTWRRLSGPGCPSDVDGAQVSVDRGWQPTGGGWTQYGCNGQGQTTALSDSTTWWNLTVGWAFEPHETAAPAICDLEVYIPNSPAAAGTATYVILGKNTADLPPLPQRRQVLIDQSAHRGSWVRLGRFDVVDGVATIELFNVGAGTLPIAADAARATCR